MVVLGSISADDTKLPECSEVCPGSQLGAKCLIACRNSTKPELPYCPDVCPGAKIGAKCLFACRPRDGY